MVDEQCGSGPLLDSAGDTLPVFTAKDEGSEDQQIKGALQKRNTLLFVFSGRHTTRV